MKIVTNSGFESKVDALVLTLFEGDSYKTFSEQLGLELGLAIKKEQFSLKFQEILVTSTSDLPYSRVMVVGLGKKEEFTSERLRKIIGKIVKTLKSHKLWSFATNVAQVCSGIFAEQDLAQICSETLILADYSFDTYLSKDKKVKHLDIVSFQWTISEKVFASGLRIGRTVAESTNYVKDLVNEPASVMTPSEIEKVARVLASSRKLKIRVMERDEMKKEGLGALLGVAQGSAQAPKLIFLEYRGAGSSAAPIALVGKGITFDSGGYNLKPTGYMEDMKCDMAGAGAVLGTLRAVSELGLKVNVLGVIPTCENMVSGIAQRPGDVVRAYNGKTIEITNTDAEGRLILADAVAYTEANYKPAAIIDVATLTGAVVVALGTVCAGVMGRDAQLISALIEAGTKSGDRVWQLPFFDEYQDAMDGSLSDLRNTSSKGKGGEAGAITGAVFISKFVEKTPWVHVDIAGTAHLNDAHSYHQKGGTGSGVRLMTYYLMGLQD